MSRSSRRRPSDTSWESSSGVSSVQWWCAETVVADRHPGRARVRTSASVMKPGVPSQPGTMKNVASSPRSASAGRTTSTSVVLPSSKLSVRSARLTAASRVASRIAGVAQNSRSPAPKSRPVGRADAVEVEVQDALSYLRPHCPVASGSGSSGGLGLNVGWPGAQCRVASGSNVGASGLEPSVRRRPHVSWGARTAEGRSRRTLWAVDPAATPRWVVENPTQSGVRRGV